MIGIARFNAYFDSECDRCLAEIWQGDPMGYDKEDQEYLCDRCLFEMEEIYEY